jgi:hypothetical protein
MTTLAEKASQGGGDCDGRFSLSSPRGASTVAPGDDVTNVTIKTPSFDMPPGTGGEGSEDWLSEYEGSVRTAEDVRRYQETVKEEKEARKRERIWERRLSRYLQPPKTGKGGRRKP